MLTTLRILFTIAATFPLLASADSPRIDALLSGTFSTQMRQPPGGLLATTEISIPFSAEIRIYSESPQYFSYAGANTTQTLFSSHPISTSLSPAVLAQYPISVSAKFNYSSSVYWFGYDPVGARNDFVSLAKGDELNYTTGEQWIYQLVIRTGVQIPPSQEEGPVNAGTLLGALIAAKESGKPFAVTEFFETYPLAGGPRTQANWYLGSATLTSVSMVPEPGSALLFVLGFLAFAVCRRDG